MRRLILLLGVATAVLVTSSTALAAPVTGAALLHPIGQSGIMGRIDFTDNGSVLAVRGTATGLQPAKTYFTLIYNVGSVPGGQAEGTAPPSSHAVVPCEPTNQSLTFDQMFVGFWNSANGTLSASKSGSSYAALGTFSTISIRQLKDTSKPPTEDNQFLVACGRVHVNP